MESIALSATLFNLTGRTALVTGGGRGLGRAIALGLARHGAAVAIADSNLDGAEETANVIRALERRSAAFHCDVSQEMQVHDMVAATLADFGQIDILVNNAGITKRIALFD